MGAGRKSLLGHLKKKSFHDEEVGLEKSAKIPQHAFKKIIS